MFVMQLIGRQADTVIDMPFAEAKACMEQRHSSPATEEEITAAMEQSSAPIRARRRCNCSPATAWSRRRAAASTSSMPAASRFDLGDSTAKADIIGKIKGDAPKATA
jgi:hypothetical protein